MEFPTLLVRLVSRPPGHDRALVLRNRQGRVTGGYHNAKLLDPEQTRALMADHHWDVVPGMDARGR
ncbi:hypothetical protein KQ304_13480 [Synechococcus sp. CS-1329]|uniref:hypothetical protein n=1 Tax=Synechococcus sp. CS-1329 TaxID=2847975 RepID=UPI00223AA02C|nr:hypothetical protein [Synechococcus sp. CS-1329]MCT0219988.1 hypothetical protein [Synechococcus sp. CS-1329]